MAVSRGELAILSWEDRLPRPAAIAWRQRPVDSYAHVRRAGRFFDEGVRLPCRRRGPPSFTCFP
jgi:hypothetical protein